MEISRICENIIIISRGVRENNNLTEVWEQLGFIWFGLVYEENKRFRKKDIGSFGGLRVFKDFKIM